jgi:hypothetical protein
MAYPVLAEIVGADVAEASHNVLESGDCGSEPRRHTMEKAVTS